MMYDERKGSACTFKPMSMDVIFVIEHQRLMLCIVEIQHTLPLCLCSVSSRESIHVLDNRVPLFSLSLCVYRL